MSLLFFATFLSVLASMYAINRPVYKIVLAQKGYAQFLQYDVETPPLREFTICTWIRAFDLDKDQSIFTYVTSGNNRFVRLWLDSGGRHMNVAINGVVTLNLQVNVVKDVWRHVCLSYQADYGAWALYIDSRLVTCEASQSLDGFVLPGGGSIIIGYGTADDGASNGFEGEVFGTNMILSSTIERNYTIKIDPQYKQKQFLKNKIGKQNKNNYIVLSDLLTDEVHNTFEKTHVTTPYVNSSKSFIKFQTPHSFVEHSVGVNQAPKKTETRDTLNEHEIFDFSMSDFRSNKEGGKVDFSKPISQPRFVKNLQDTKQSQAELNVDTRNIPTVSEYETPPPPPYGVYFDETLNVGELPITEPYKVKDSSSKKYQKIFRKNPTTELAEIEMPPPVEKNPKVYGQWTSSRFAGTVLKYLKSINFKNSEQFLRKVPHTIPLYKISDSYPYSSDLKTMKVRPPSQFKRKNVVEKRYDIVKRNPQINVQIIEDDLRSKILKMHAGTRPKKVEITNRGAPRQHKVKRFYRNAKYERNSDENLDSLEEVSYQKLSAQVKGLEKRHNHRYFIQPVHLHALLRHSAHDSQNTESEIVAENNDMYTKSLSNANKWHNVKSYSNDFTPRKINMDSEETETKIYPAIRFKYVPDKYKIVEEDDPTILNGRKLASTVSDQSTLDQDSISIFKYNHGYLPTREKGNDTRISYKIKRPSKRKIGGNSFDKHVKIGNALNERIVIGEDEEQKKLSFVGGNENIPDINRYRSDLDDEKGKVPPSLSPRVCKNVELYDRVLYVQPDESIDMTYILSPVKAKNIAIEFVIQNYKKCSLTDSSFQKSEMLFIDWNKTPVRLFGGAYPMTTTDLCGFF